MSLGVDPCPSTPRGGRSLAAGETAALIDVRSLALSYSGRTAFREVTLAVRSGSVTAIVGPSGCGKTSFLSSLNRLSDLIPGCSVSGHLAIDGIDVLDPDCDVVSLRRRVGMIFQRPNPFPFSIHRNLAFPLREHGVRDRATIDSKIEEALRSVGLWPEVRDRLEASALSLSGGQQQRLCLARALVLGPEILLLDEPCSSLDPVSSGIIEELIASLAERYTLVVVTHNLAQARRIADEVAVFWTHDGTGHLLESGSVIDVFEQPKSSVTRDYVAGHRG